MSPSLIIALQLDIQTTIVIVTMQYVKVKLCPNITRPVNQSKEELIARFLIATVQGTKHTPL